MILAAQALLDDGGEKAVTLRAVGHACGLSHNAPYRHFANRTALLAAVATMDFDQLTEHFRRIRHSNDEPTKKVLAAISVGARLSEEHPARYELLFANPEVAAQEESFAKAANDAFSEFVAIVAAAQAANTLPATPTPVLAHLMFCTMHGLVAARKSGHAHPDGPPMDATTGVRVLVDLITPSPNATRP